MVGLCECLCVCIVHVCCPVRIFALFPFHISYLFFVSPSLILVLFCATGCGRTPILVINCKKNVCVHSVVMVLVVVGGSDSLLTVVCGIYYFSRIDRNELKRNGNHIYYLLLEIGLTLVLVINKERESQYLFHFNLMFRIAIIKRC